MALPADVTWADVAEAERAVATSYRNARGGVAVVRHGLGGADPTGARGLALDSDTEALRGTFRLVVPLVEARGRVEPLRLDLHYQARMWFGGAEAVAASLDGDEVHAPGWSVGLTKLLGGILIEADGVRRPARRTTVVGSALDDIDVSYVTTDGSDITYRIRLRPSSGSDPTSAAGEVSYPDGSLTVLQGQAGTNSRGGLSVLHTRLYATAMVDAQGNVTTVEYRSFGTPQFPARVSSVVDPLGREVRFHYAGGPGGTFLTAVTGPGQGNGVRVLARLTYRVIEAYRRIHATNPAMDVLNPFVFAVQGIFHPATGTGYWFGDTDSYSRYGMLTKVLEQTQMSHTASSLEDAGTLAPGTTIRARAYDFPAAAPTSGERQAFPRYSTRTETVAGVAAPLVTRYDVTEEPGATLVRTTLPDGGRRVTELDPATGLPVTRTTYAPDGSLVRSDDYEWAPGGSGPARLTRLTETDTSGFLRRTEYAYTGQGRLREQTVRDWVPPAQVDNAPLLQRRRYAYVEDPAYANRGIRGLVSRSEVYGPDPLLPEERTDYAYDSTPLQPTPGLGRNVFATPGFRADLLALLPTDANDRRGLLTRTEAWLSPHVQGVPSTVVTEAGYTRAGGLAELKVDGRTRLTIGYAAESGYALPVTVTRGTVTGPRRWTTATSRLAWDVGTGVLRSIRRPSTGVTYFEYDPALRLTRGHNARELDLRRDIAPTQLGYTDATRTADGALVATTETHVDGLGAPRRVVQRPSGAPAIESHFEYDAGGRLVRFERGRRTGAAPRWTELEYDGAGRVTTTISPEGSLTTSRYGRADAPGDVLATGIVRCDTDPWGRQRFLVVDGLGRTVQVLEPGAGGEWTETRYAYDARSNLLAVRSDANRSELAVPSRRFRYDGLSRMTARHLIERSPTLDGGGNPSSAGLWSDVYGYDADSNLIRHVDPRGVVTTYDYADDPLGRLFAVHVALPPAVAGAQPILPVPPVRFSYMRSGDPMRLRRAWSPGVYDEAYRYDASSRAARILTTFADCPASPVLQRVVRRDGAQRVEVVGVAVPGEDEVQLRHHFDAAGRRVGLSGSAAGAWSVTAGFGERGILRDLTYRHGSWTAVEVFTVDDVARRLVRQELTVGGSRVLDRSYYYSEATRPRSVGRPAGPAAAGQLLAIRDNLTASVSDCDYDDLGRLVSVATGRLRQETGYRYSYDAAGNRTRSLGVAFLPPPPMGTLPEFVDLGEAAADGQREVAFDPLTNRLAGPGVAYDAAGCPTVLPRKDGSVLLLDYDGLGRLARVRRDGEPEEERYTYRHDHRRIVTAREDGSARYSVWRGATSGSHFERGAGASALQHAETPGIVSGRVAVRLVGPTASTAPEFLHHAPDALLPSGPGRTPPAQPSGARPYGSEGSAGALTPPAYVYHSYVRSRFGLDDALARDYDPETGRFLQPDPLGQGVYRADDPQTLNLYAFVRGDPLNRRDPLGLCDCDGGGVPQTLPDGGVSCTYPYGKTVYETIVRAERGEGEGILEMWLPESSRWGYDPSRLLGPEVEEAAVERAVDKALEKKLRQLLEKEQACSAARASFAAAATAYARVSANVRSQNLKIEALQFQAAEVAADTAENVAEQREDFSPAQAGAAAAGRAAAAMSIRRQMQAAEIDRALLNADRANAIDALRTAAEARDAACQ